MIVDVIATYHRNADDMFRSALRFSEMAQAMSGIATYAGLPADDTAREGDTIIVDATFWGVFKQQGHSIFIERIDPDDRVIQSREFGNGIRKWDHTLSIRSEGNLTVWHDRIIIDAGWRTLFVARFAMFLYTRRHRYRRAQTIIRTLSRDPPSS
jgi:hypothetical protein